VPPYRPDFATSNIPPRNKVNTNYYGQRPEKYFSPLPAGKYGISTNRSTQRRDQANQGKSGLEAERVWALGALCSMRSNMKFAAERRQETNFLNNKEKEKSIEDYVERETAVARQRVEDAETAIQQEQDDMKSAESGGSTSRVLGVLSW